MNAKHCCVVDADGKYVTLVLVLENAGVETVQYYTLKEGEFLVETCPPSEKPYAGMDGFIKPRWNGTEWVETATEDEISAWEAEHPAMPEPLPTTEQRVSDLEEQLVQADETAIALYEAQEAQEVINAQQDEALMEIYEMIG